MLVGPNGKPTLNESVTRAAKAESSIDNLIEGMLRSQLDIRRITLAEWKRLFPKYPANAGKPKKKHSDR